MRGVIRGVVVVVVVVGFSLAAGASPREREPRSGMMGKVVKKLRALGDLITIPVPASKP